MRGDPFARRTTYDHKCARKNGGWTCLRASPQNKGAIRRLLRRQVKQDKPKMGPSRDSNFDVSADHRSAPVAAPRLPAPLLPSCVCFVVFVWRGPALSTSTRIDQCASLVKCGKPAPAPVQPTREGRHFRDRSSFLDHNRHPHLRAHHTSVRRAVDRPLHEWERSSSERAR
mgnify:CR=1 FL=1